MRGQFVKTLLDLARTDPSLMLLTADLGFMAFEPFAERYPDRFINVGVSEQAMIGMATGLADAGFTPYCYSIAPFVALRPLEFIRNGPVLHQLPVRVVGVGGGVEYGHAGPSHYGIEDVGCLRTLGSLTIVAPADAAQTDTALRAVHGLPGPAYIRIGKDDARSVPGLDGRFELGRLQLLRTGARVALVGMGGVCAEVARAGEILSAGGMDVTVAVAASVDPVPREDLLAIARGHGCVVAVEAHVPNGGLGSLVAETIAEAGLACRLVRAAVRAADLDGLTGGESFLHRSTGIDAESVAVLAAAAWHALEHEPQPSHG